MPAQSKVKTPKSTPKPKIRDENKYYCTCCGRGLKDQNKNFPSSQSMRYRSNNGCITVCYHCFNEMFDNYLKEGQTQEQAIRRMCMHFDIYYHPEIIRMAEAHFAQTKSTSLMASYISKSNLVKFKGKTFDDTLYEEFHLSDEYMKEIKTSQEAQRERERKLREERRKEKQREQEEKAREIKEQQEFEINSSKITDEMREFWGEGWDEDPKAILFFEKRYHHWTDGIPDMDTALEALYKQICMVEYQINRAYQTGVGKPTDYINTLNTLLGSANIKPVQISSAKNAQNENLQSMSLSEMVRVWEDEYKEPVPEPDPEFEDVDGVKNLIFTFFFGHLCKMLKIKNKYSKKYEEEIAKYTVEPPTYEEADESAVSDDIFEDSASESSGE